MTKQDDLPGVEIDWDGTLHCPACDDTWLHQEEVETGWRDEDMDVSRHVSNRAGIKTDVLDARRVSMPNGYGYRRDYLVVRFRCEHCGDGFEMCIRQHKGQTIFYWVKLGSPSKKEVGVG